MNNYRAELRRAAAGLWDVIYRGERIVQASRNPEIAVCAALQLRGLSGRVVFVHRRGTVASGMGIEAGAKLAKNRRVRAGAAGSSLSEHR